MSLFFALLPLTASSQQGQDTAQSHIDAALAHYEDLEYERALDELDQAHRRAFTQKDTVSILLYEGIILSEIGRKDEADAAFRAALRIQPQARLSVKVSPKIEQQFEAIRQELLRDSGQAQATAKTDVQQSPAEATNSQMETSLEPTPSSRSVEDIASRHRIKPSKSIVLDPRVLLPAVAGGALLAGGGVFYALARGEYSRLKNSDPGLPGLDDVERTTSRGRTFQTVGFSLMGAGLVGLGIATSLYVLGNSPTPLTLSVGTDGTSAFVYGRWP